MKDTECGDNLGVYVVGREKETLLAALKLIEHQFNTVKSFTRTNKELILHLYEGSNPMITPLKPSECLDTVWKWLETAEIYVEPDHDGSNEKGWSVSTLEIDNGKLGIWTQYKISIKPEWIMLGK